MNLTTWFKGLCVFVLSSLVTASATMTLDPAGFNFSRQGLAKVGAAALVIGVKSVLLYLKQSPLPGNQTAGIANWTRISGLVACCLILPASGLLTGCVSSWDQTTYASLAASKALIDCAVAGYNHADTDIRNSCAADPQDPAFSPQPFYLPQTSDVHQAVDKARQIQVAAVEAFAAYAAAKVGKDPAATLQQKQAAVMGFLVQLPALVNSIRALMGKSTVSAVLHPPDIRKPMQAIAALKPAVQLLIDCTGEAEVHRSYWLSFSSAMNLCGAFLRCDLSVSFKKPQTKN
ncbi:MAG TPA: hypothetical protein VHA06_15655 [Candidatus Angelobacter sp.]|nr:hypothetical protein [Candidatus Angelobacter sp.]